MRRGTLLVLRRRAVGRARIEIGDALVVSVREQLIDPELGVLE